MVYRLVVGGLCVVALGACQQSGVAPGPAASVLAPSSVSVRSVERPFKADIIWTVAAIQWAGTPGQDTSLFGGRCSVLSDYVIDATFEGQATHAGRVTGATSHCSQIVWSPTGPAAATYSDGRGSVLSANGSTIILRYGNGTTGVDARTGETWFRDDFTFNGGTGCSRARAAEAKKEAASSTSPSCSGAPRCRCG